MDEVALNNFIKQIEELWIIPELERRGTYKERIWAVLIVFKENVEVLFNTETSLTVTIQKNGNIIPGEPVKVEHLAECKVTDVQIPEEVFLNYSYIAAITTSPTWFIKFDFIPNKKQALKRISLAIDFLSAAEVSLNNKVKAYNLFQALEQAVHASLLNNALQQEKIKNGKTHAATKTIVNLETKTGYMPAAIASLFNKLHDNRGSIYSEEELNETFDSSSFLIVKEYIEAINTNLIQ
ncbi:MAG: hypothetical protein EOP56_03180 [Sphingobacteriales bacterium]|nr:MAG: hypothetical protein EOP56_03180 [Sphingobacteriales bacterium]